jgi:hypothetical protein
MASDFDPSIKNVLPLEKIYTLQIGSEQFHVSGASLSSDSPSYFTNFFLNEQNKDKILIIDRSSEIFRLILQHLQGYHLEIPNADVFTRLFNDALYYSLPQLMKNLTIKNEYYYTIIESEYLKIPRKIMSDSAKGNYPSFFSVSNDALYRDISPLMINRNWIRPPPQAAPHLSRPLSLLKDLISLLENVEIQIKSKEHRRSLIKEAKYYRFYGVVQKLIDHRIIFNSLTNDEEIIVELSHIDHKFITLKPGCEYSLFYYQRPYEIDTEARLLNFQIESNNDVLLDSETKTLIIKQKTLSKLARILKSLLSKNQKNTTIFDVKPDELVLPLQNIGHDSSLKYGCKTVNLWDVSAVSQTKKRKLDSVSDPEQDDNPIQKQWVLKTGILQFFYKSGTGEIEAKLLKGDVYPNTSSSFYSNLDFV